VRRLFLALLLLTACGDDDGGAADAAPPGADAVVADASFLQPQDRDILDTRLALNLTTRAGSASIDVAAAEGPGAFVEVGDLQIEAVTVGGAPVPYVITQGNMTIALPPGAATVDIDYVFQPHEAFDGWDPTPGFTLLWPYHCGNLFPCDSRPVDGTRFSSLTVSGVPAGQVAVFPAAIPGDAPSYMPAVAVGAYTYEKLGDTAGGVEVGVWFLPGDETAKDQGAGDLLGYMQFFETTLGPYHFGDVAASVSVAWGPGQYGGMEHHPLWHVSRSAFGDKNTHAHEAAHGWFGNGVRLACWEDFVLSEGAATYLAARAIEAVEGPAAGDAEWAAYETRLMNAVAGEDTLAWPTDACNTIDIAVHPVWSSIPYMKGAFFLRAVEQQVGRAAFDQALGAFYAAYRGKAAGVQDLLDTIQAETGFDAQPLATMWLRSLGIPQ
jgi:hypothetical protein